MYVRDDRRLLVDAPLSLYHDLRFLHCAAKGWSTHQAAEWLADWRPDPGPVRTLATYGKGLLLEAEARLDVQVVERLTAPDLHGRAFFTINHPSRAALCEVIARLHQVLDLPYERPAMTQEPLGDTITPLEEAVIDALDLEAEPRENWVIGDRSLTPVELMSLHLDWYHENPAVVVSGLQDHERRAAILGLR